MKGTTAKWSGIKLSIGHQTSLIEVTSWHSRAYIAAAPERVRSSQRAAKHSVPTSLSTMLLRQDRVDEVFELLRRKIKVCYISGGRSLDTGTKRDLETKHAGPHKRALQLI